MADRSFQTLLTPRNRGILLDCLVFVFNTVLVGLLASVFAEVVGAANESPVARTVLIAFYLGVVFLQPVAAVLKRRRAHERLPSLAVPEPKLLFNPFFYFLATLLFLILTSERVLDALDGVVATSETADYFGLPPWLFTTLFLGVPAAAIAVTALVYWYFHAPKRRPILAFLATPRAEAAGDACLYLNMLLHQVLWGFLIASLPVDFDAVGERLFYFAFTAALIYFPPRLFYLAEDGGRPTAWLTMLLANAPILVRLLFVANSRSVGY